MVRSHLALCKNGPMLEHPDVSLSLWNTPMSASFTVEALDSPFPGHLSLEQASASCPCEIWGGQRDEAQEPSLELETLLCLITQTQPSLAPATSLVQGVVLASY